MTHRSKLGADTILLTMNRFECDSKVDPALPAVAIPEGYVRSDVAAAAPREDNRPGDDTKPTEDTAREIEELGDFLRFCAEADEGRFPDDLSLTTVLATANRLVADPKMADRTDRTGATFGGLFGLQIGLGMVGEKVHCLGKGRRANDGKGIVARYTLDGTTIAIADDFSIRTIKPEEVPGLPK